MLIMKSKSSTTVQVRCAILSTCMKWFSQDEISAQQLVLRGLHWSWSTAHSHVLPINRYCVCVSTYINPYYNPAAGDRGVNIFKRTKHSGGCSVTTHACSWFTCCHASEGGYDIRLQVSLDWGALSHTLFLQAPSKQTKGEEFTETETAREMEDNKSLEDSPTHPPHPQQHAK